MTGRDLERPERAGTTGPRSNLRPRPRRGVAARVVTLGTLGLIVAVLLSACGTGEVGRSPYSTIDPASPGADDIQTLYKLIFWMALVVFIGVQFAIVYTAMRFRRSRTVAGRPVQIHGNRRLEIIWTVIPAVVLLIILIPTITTLYAQSGAAEEADIVVDVYGKQWWWEMHYQDDAAGQPLGIVTANELHLPVGQETIVRLHSNNVIHSFWVPRLAGKIDVMPGHVNALSFIPSEPGEYFGECAEFCGTMHAWMRFKVVVHPEEDFYRWANAWRTGHLSTTNQEAPAEIAKAPQLFALCLACHRVNGMEGSAAPIGIDAPTTMGPNLTLFGCRDTIAAGMLVNNRENLIAWLYNPGAIKPANFMSTQIMPGTLQGQEAAIADYLLTLKPEGGCIEPETSQE